LRGYTRAVAMLPRQKRTAMVIRTVLDRDRFVEAFMSDLPGRSEVE
jgi:hypothetical protein